MEVVFLKIEKLRRLYPCERFSVQVQRGEDGTFGLGLTEDNEVVEFHHDRNVGALEQGDQICAVGDDPLVRERLASLIERRWADADEVTLHITRAAAAPKPATGEVFANLKVLQHGGGSSSEWSTDLWRLRTSAVWGACWTVPMPSNVSCFELAVHRSLLLTDPLLGKLELPLAEIESGPLTTRWYCMRPQGAKASSRQIAGEVLLSIRRYTNLSSVSPVVRWSDDSDGEDERKVTPAQHRTEPIPAICDEPLVPPSLSVAAR